MPRKELAPLPPPPPPAEGVRPAANTLQPPTPGAVARLLRSLRGLPEAVRAPGPGSTGSRVVRLDDMDHAEAALTGLPGFSNYFPSDLTETMAALAIETPGGL